MEDPFSERLSDYVDGELPPEERLEVDAHLDRCSRCAVALRELRSLRREARTLARPEPPERVWESIAERLKERSRPPAPARSTRYLYPAVALAATLIIGVGIWLLGSSRTQSPEDTQALVNMITEELEAAESHYDNAIGGLEQIIAQNQGVLPPELNAVLGENLDLIEKAIAESRSALATEPESTAAQESLLEALRRKVGLLQNTILLINEVRKGEADNALERLERIRESERSSNPI